MGTAEGVGRGGRKEVHSAHICLQAVNWDIEHKHLTDQNGTFGAMSFNLNVLKNWCWSTQFFATAAPLVTGTSAKRQGQIKKACPCCQTSAPHSQTADCCSCISQHCQLILFSPMSMHDCARGEGAMFSGHPETEMTLIKLKSECE